MKFLTRKNIILAVIALIFLYALSLVPKMINQGEYTKYLLYVPEEKPESGKYPLMLFLHGSGSRGSDLSLLKDRGPRSYFVDSIAFPFVLVSPLCKKNDEWHSKYLIDLLGKIEKKLPIDPDRVYVTGLSMGGKGTWHLAQDAPGRFAAIVPVCGRSEYGLEKLSGLKDVSVWAFHGAKDDLTPYQETERLVNKLEDIEADVKFTLYPDLGHKVWDSAYSNPELYTWLLSKRRNSAGKE